MVKFPITKKGFELLEKEIKYLKHVERPAIIEAISTARDLAIYRRMQNITQPEKNRALLKGEF